MEEKLRTVMIIDDTPANLKILSEILKISGYRVIAFPNGEMAISAAIKNPPSLILLDIMMPELDGYKVCKELKRIDVTKEIPIIFISALNNSSDKVNAFEIGGVDYITKPFQPEEVIARVKMHISMYEMTKKLEDYNHKLEEMVSEKVKEISDSQKASSLALAKLTESRDYETGKHVERVQVFCLALAEELRKTKYSGFITQEFLDAIYYSSPLHDIGKVGIPDDILLKPGSLTKEEFEIIKTHVKIGSNTLKVAAEIYPTNKILQMGIDICRYHHEKWDGSGYIEGLKGEEIPISARIMALVDAYDAIRSERPYKKGLSHSVACELIENDLGTHFDPIIGNAFLKIKDKFNEIYEEFGEK